MKTLFGTSGIRGVFNQDLTTEICYEVAKALGTLLPPGARVCLATDTRTSGAAIKEAIFSGLLSCGTQLTDLGILPTPALALLTREWGFDTGIMVTASHNPPEFNGIKLFNGDSLGYSQAQEQQLEKIYLEKSFRRGSQGSLSHGEGMSNSYRRFIENRLPSNKLNKNLRVVVDPGNGAASGFASKLFTEMGLKVLPLNDTPDGLFPGRNPEPKEDTLHDTVRFLREMKADLAVCFDGDADRVVFCDREGFLGFNELIAFISRLVIEENGKRKVASTVETGRLLDLAIEDLGAEVIRGKVGDVHVAHLAREKDAAIGVEQVGVYIIPEAGYYPDSIYATLLLLSRIKDVVEIRDFFKKLPDLYFEKKKIACANHLKQEVMAKVEEKAYILGTKDINTLDGLRFEYEDSWMLIRASGTEPAIRIIAEST
ncbi:phosphoglucosamine mutase, partial [Chloroflexota bacterium]